MRALGKRPQRPGVIATLLLLIGWGKTGRVRQAGGKGKTRKMFGPITAPWSSPTFRDCSKCNTHQMFFHVRDVRGNPLPHLRSRAQPCGIFLIYSSVPPCISFCVEAAGHLTPFFSTSSRGVRGHVFPTRRAHITSYRAIGVTPPSPHHSPEPRST